MNPVLVTTEFRGVFFGYIDGDLPPSLPGSVTLANARNCIYWSADVGGFLGLAKTGPSDGCRIGAQVDRLEVYKVTSICPVMEAAAKRWDGAPCAGQ